MQLLGKMRSRPKETGDKRNSWNKQAGVAPTTRQQRSQLLMIQYLDSGTKTMSLKSK